jgi:hypothetical protein
MDKADQRAHQFDAAVLSMVEAGVLAGRVGDTFTGVITEIDDRESGRGLVMVREPAVEAPVTTVAGGPLPLGVEVPVRLVAADPVTRSVAFRLEGSHEGGQAR